MSNLRVMERLRPLPNTLELFGELSKTLFRVIYWKIKASPKYPRTIWRIIKNSL